ISGPTPPPRLASQPGSASGRKGRPSVLIARRACPSSALRVYAIQLGFAHSSDPYRNHDSVVAHVAAAALVDGLGVVAEAGVRLMADRTFQDGAFCVSPHG